MNGDMVQHIFKKENHEGLKERLEVIKYNDELRSMDGDDSQRDEEIFKKSFSNFHISGVSSSYSISNDYDRSDNYYPKNQNVDHRRNIQVKMEVTERFDERINVKDEREVILDIKLIIENKIIYF